MDRPHWRLACVFRCGVELAVRFKQRSDSSRGHCSIRLEAIAVRMASWLFECRPEVISKTVTGEFTNHCPHSPSVTAGFPTQLAAKHSPGLFWRTEVQSATPRMLLYSSPLQPDGRRPRRVHLVTTRRGRPVAAQTSRTS